MVVTIAPPALALPCLATAPLPCLALPTRPLALPCLAPPRLRRPPAVRPPSQPRCARWVGGALRLGGSGALRLRLRLRGRVGFGFGCGCGGGRCGFGCGCGRGVLSLQMYRGALTIVSVVITDVNCGDYICIGGRSCVGCCRKVLRQFFPAHGDGNCRS